MAVALTAARARGRLQVASMSRNPPAWTFDLPAIAAACERLGITHDVILSCARYSNGRWYGMHTSRQVKGAKVSAINVANWLPPEWASRMLWHELTHAAQYERGENVDTRRLARKDHDAYLEHPLEREAVENEGYAQFFPLVA